MNVQRNPSPVIAAALLLAGCDGTFTSDLATDPPADPDIVAVRASLLGVVLEKAGGARTTLDFRDGEPVDLLDFAVSGAPMRLFTDERLSDGHYTGIRLLFDEDADAAVVDAFGGEFPVALASGPFAAVDFTITNDERSDHAWTLTLDLRRSLVFDDSSDEYTLTPTLRTVRTAKAAQITGGIEQSSCPDDTSLGAEAAVYVFAGADIVPDDVDVTGSEPYATARLVDDPASDAFTYTLRFLPAGDYTLALTCIGDTDEPDEDDDLAFRQVQNVRLDSGESERIDFD
jgi:Domain of unknown function (DUF4382)